MKIKTSIMNSNILTQSIKESTQIRVVHNMLLHKKFYYLLTFIATLKSMLQVCILYTVVSQGSAYCASTQQRIYNKYEKMNENIYKILRIVTIFGYWYDHLFELIFWTGYDHYNLTVFEYNSTVIVLAFNVDRVAPVSMSVSPTFSSPTNHCTRCCMVVTSPVTVHWKSNSLLPLWGCGSKVGTPGASGEPSENT